MMSVPFIPQIPSIGVWEGRRVTSERGADSATPHVRAVLDDRGRVMVLMTHNTDFGDACTNGRAKITSKLPRSSPCRATRSASTS